MGYELTRGSCQFDKCPRKTNSGNAMCFMHRRWVQKGVALPPEGVGEVKVNPPCNFPECGRPTAYKGLCWAHYKQGLKGVELTEIKRVRRPGEAPDPCPVQGCSRFATATRGICTKHYERAKKYGLSPGNYLEKTRIRACQNQGCRSEERLHMDHDHLTGMFRGVLCSSCNTALGSLRDSPRQVQGLKDYLEESIRKGLTPLRE